MLAAVLQQMALCNLKVYLSISTAENNKRRKRYEKLHAVPQSLPGFVWVLHCDLSDGSVWPQPPALPASVPIFIATYGPSMAAAASRCQALECAITAAPSGALASLLYCLLNVYINSFAGPRYYLWDTRRVGLFTRSSCSGLNSPWDDLHAINFFLLIHLHLLCPEKVIKEVTIEARKKKKKKKGKLFLQRWVRMSLSTPSVDLNK